MEQINKNRVRGLAYTYNMNDEQAIYVMRLKDIIKKLTDEKRKYLDIKKEYLSHFTRRKPIPYKNTTKKRGRPPKQTNTIKLSDKMQDQTQETKEIT